MPEALPRPCSPTVDGYLNSANDSWAFSADAFAATADQKYLNSPSLRFDASHLFDNGIPISIPPQLSYGSPSESFLGMPPTPMSRNTSRATQLAEPESLFRIESQESHFAIPFDHHQEQLEIMTGSVPFDYPLDPLPHLPKRPAEISSVELHRQEVEKGREHNSLKRLTSDFPKQPTNPAKSNKTNARGSPTKANRPYVRPKHPRVHCPECPADHKGFRGEHELNRHFDRKHAVHKKAWVVRDMSGAGLLSKCKACTSRRKYGVDYNATAHLKRQHFNPSKTPGIQMPENIRDWIEEVEGGQDERKRGAREKNSGGETPKEEEEDEEDSVDDDDEEEEGAEKDSRAAAQSFGTEAAQSTGSSVHTYLHKMQEHRQQQMLFREAGRLSAQALHEASSKSWLVEGSIAQYDRAEESGGSCHHTIRNSASHSFGTAAFQQETPFPLGSIYEFNQQLLRDNCLPDFLPVGIEDTTVSPTDIFWADGHS
ncbi:hypothetical protein FN846DRAFT_981977 [Sphaerosporella brunnea]|uniref:DUF7896 domain-containing protein n=2 Tax=Sphaerosporella brunnea TaxID=1250544 RepID=A0A5J5EC25_9PEZI|nr:hypothetical protein FN846DRAFT_981977 [Sphaerosporella brunnea]